VHVKNRLELRSLALTKNIHHPNETSLSALCKTYLWIVLDKSFQITDYSKHPLPNKDKVLQYCALDALVSRLLAEEILKQTDKTIREGNLYRPPKGSIAGDNVILQSSGRNVASGILEFVGGMGKQQRLGNITVGSNRCILRLVHVNVPNHKPPISDGTFD